MYREDRNLLLVKLSRRSAPICLNLIFFVITARVKGGNSGCPVINNEGYVVGTVFQIPFDSYGGSDGGRYDIMGYGVCLPSKYVIDLSKNPDIHQLVSKDGYYIEE